MLGQPNATRRRDPVSNRLTMKRGELIFTITTGKTVFLTSKTCGF